MKSKTRVPLFLVLAALACARPASARADGWTRYTYPGEEFSVELPAMPWVFNTRRNVGGKLLESEKVRVFGLYSGGVVYVVVSFDRPRPEESDDLLAGYLWGGRGLTRKGDARSGSAAGSEYEVGLGFKGTARLFRTKNRAYLLKAFSDVDGQGEAIGRFLNSFALGAKPTGDLVFEEPAAHYTPP